MTEQNLSAEATFLPVANESPRHTEAAVTWLLNFNSVETRRAYRSAVGDFASSLKMDSLRNITQATRLDAIGWRDQMRDRGLSPRTIAARLAALSSLFSHFEREHLVSANPFAGVTRPKVRAARVETSALTRREVRRILDAPDPGTLQGLRDRALLTTLFFTGCRVSEPCKLRVRNFHFDQGYRVLDFTVKGGKANRIAIHPELENALVEYLQISGHGKMAEARLFQPIRRCKVPSISHDTVNRVFRTYAQRVGLPASVSTHSARATFITEALQNGHPIEAVQNSVAHASVVTTLAYDKRKQSLSNSASFAVNYPR